MVVVAALAATCGVHAAPAAAASWYPHPADATWTYQWSDSVYNSTPTKEKITVKEQKGKSFLLAWSTKDLENPAEAAASEGLMAFEETISGVVNTDWQSKLIFRHGDRSTSVVELVR